MSFLKTIQLFVANNPGLTNKEIAAALPENAVRDVARQCSDAIKKALKKKPKPSWNVVVPPILKEYHEKVKPMGVSLVMFNSVIGRLNGRYGVDS